MLTVHIIDKGDAFHVFKEKTNKNETKKDLLYEKSKYFGPIVYVFDFIDKCYNENKRYKKVKVDDIYQVNKTTFRVFLKKKHK